jgi:hypothetical protein
MQVCNRATEAGKAVGRGDIREIAGPGDRRQTYLATSRDSRFEKQKQVSQTLPEGGEQREQIATTRQRKSIQRRKEIDDTKNLHVGGAAETGPVQSSRVPRLPNVEPDERSGSAYRPNFEPDLWSGLNQSSELNVDTTTKYDQIIDETLNKPSEQAFGVCPCHIAGHVVSL